MKNINELLTKINGLDADAQAKAIANFMAANNRKKTVEDARRDTRSKCFAGVTKKLTKQQQESLLYEFLTDNAATVNQWMRRKYPEAFMGSYKRSE